MRRDCNYCLFSRSTPDECVSAKRQNPKRFFILWRVFMNKSEMGWLNLKKDDSGFCKFLGKIMNSDLIEALDTLKEIDTASDKVFKEIKRGKINTIFIPILNQPSLWKFWTWHKRKSIRRRNYLLYCRTKEMFERQEELMKHHPMPAGNHKPLDWRDFKIIDLEGKEEKHGNQ